MTAPTALLTDAAEWRLLGLLFECPTAQWRQQVEALAGEVQDASLQQAARAAMEEASEGDYHSIFGPGGPAAPREVSYHETVQLGYLLSELTAFYDAFCFRPDTAEALDHVAFEAGFISYLRLKQAFAMAGDNTEAAERAGQAANTFIRDHLARIGHPLAASLANCGLSYLAAAGQALAARTGPPRTAPPFPILAREIAAEGSSFDCGIC